MTKSKTLIYAAYDGDVPVISIKDSGGVGWFWHSLEGRWKRCDLHLYLRSKLCPKREWESMFGPIPPLPRSMIDEAEIDESPLEPPVVWRCGDEIEEEWEKEKPGSARARQLQAEMKAPYAGVWASRGPEWQGIVEKLEKTASEAEEELN
jgi:hypothetical protein